MAAVKEKTRISHANCDHPSTTAARTKCRKNQETRTDVSSAKVKRAPKLQQELTSSYRDKLLGVAGTTVDRIRDKLGLSEADLADIDLWFEREMPDLVKIVKQEHKNAAMLTTAYLRQHAALEGFKMGAVPAEIIEEQLIKSLTATGPGAFKKHIAGGGTEDAALKVMQTTLPGSAERLAMLGARDTLTDAVEDSDSSVLGYTRRVGGKACAYCIKQSGEVVYSDRNVEFHAHDHCTCVGEPFYLDDSRRAVTRLTDAEMFREIFDELDKKSILDLWNIPSLMVKDYDNPDFGLYAYEGHAINRYLREGAFDDDGQFIGDARMEQLMTMLEEEYNETLDDLVERLYFTIQNAPELQEDMIAFRGMVDGDKVFGEERWKENLEGLTWFDEGFTSTTVSQEYADVWAGGALAIDADSAMAALMSRVQNKSVMMNLLIRKGTKLVSLDSEIAGGEQYEVLLQRGKQTKFKIIKDYRIDKKTGVRILDVEVTFGD